MMSALLLYLQRKTESVEVAATNKTTQEAHRDATRDNNSNKDGGQKQRVE